MKWIAQSDLAIGEKLGIVMDLSYQNACSSVELSVHAKSISVAEVTVQSKFPA